eukprot:4554763-Amphidinium_carterae.1
MVTHDLDNARSCPAPTCSKILSQTHAHITQNDGFSEYSEQCVKVWCMEWRLSCSMRKGCYSHGCMMWRAVVASYLLSSMTRLWLCCRGVFVRCLAWRIGEHDGMMQVPTLRLEPTLSWPHRDALAARRC